VAEDVAAVGVEEAIVEEDSGADSGVGIAGAVVASVEAEVDHTATVTEEVIGVGEEVAPEVVVEEATEVHAADMEEEEMVATSGRIVHEAAARITAIHRPRGIPFKNKQTNEKRLFLSPENRQRHLTPKIVKEREKF
jgi:hypothetical protein